MSVEYSKQTCEALCRSGYEEAMKEAKELYRKKGSTAAAEIDPADYMPHLNHTLPGYQKIEGHLIIDNYCRKWQNDFEDWKNEQEGIKRREKQRVEERKQEEKRREEEARRREEEARKEARRREEEDWERENNEYQRTNIMLLAQKERDWKMSHPDCVIEQKTSDTITITILGVSFDMQLVEGGCLDTYTFLSDFYIGTTPVTLELWMMLMRDCPFGGCGLTTPAVGMDFKSVKAFLRRLQQFTQVAFELPTCQQREWARKGGQKSKGYKYAGSDNLDDVAWMDGCIHPVGQLAPNELGLYDMDGNGCEYVIGHPKKTKKYEFNPTSKDISIINEHLEGVSAEYWYDDELCGLRLVLNIPISDEVMALKMAEIEELNKKKK